MTISTYQVQNILRTYGKQLGRSRKASGQAGESERLNPADQVDISNEARRQQVINKIAQEIISQITNQPQAKSQIEKEALSRLSQEFGRSLEIFRNRDGSLRFAVIDDEAKEVIEELPSDKSEELSRRFADIAQSIVDQNMIS